MACFKVAPVFGILEMVTVTMETAKISKTSKCSKLYKILHQCSLTCVDALFDFEIFKMAAVTLAILV